MSKFKKFCLINYLENEYNYPKLNSNSFFNVISKIKIDNYYIFSDDIIFENDNEISLFCGYCLKDGNYINNLNYKNFDLSEDLIGTYMRINYNKVKKECEIKSDFYGNNKYIYNSDKCIIVTNNMKWLIEILTEIDEIQYNFNNIRFNLEVTEEVLNGKVFLPVLCFRNIEKNEIDNFKICETFFDIKLNENFELMYTKKDIFDFIDPSKQNEDNEKYNFFIKEIKKEMLLNFNAIKKQYPKHKYLAELTAGGDTRTTLSFFLENEINDIKYTCLYKDNKTSVASIGDTDAFYFKYLVDNFKLSTIEHINQFACKGNNLKKAIELDDDCFYENISNFSSSNGFLFDNIFLFRGGDGEMSRNYGGFKRDEDLFKNLDRSVNSPHIRNEIKDFLYNKQIHTSNNLITQYNLWSITNRAFNSSKSPKLNYPCWNLIETKNLLRLRQNYNIFKSTDLYKIQKDIWIPELKEININDKEYIKPNIRTRNVDINSLKKKYSSEISKHVISVEKEMNIFKKNEIKKFINFIIEKFNLYNENIDVLHRINDSFDNIKIDKKYHWTIKQLYYRLKIIYDFLNTN